jgi:hypothetical protein
MKIETRTGLWVSSPFTEKFGNKEIIPAKTVPTFKTLERAMNDSEIKSELGAQECTLEDIAAFLENPPEGTKDGYWNIFYVAGCVVGVDWGSGSREWRVDAWGLGDGRWGAGSRAFSRNWHSEPLKSESSLTLESLAARVGKLENILEEVRNLLVL